MKVFKVVKTTSKEEELTYNEILESIKELVFKELFEYLAKKKDKDRNKAKEK